MPARSGQPGRLAQPAAQQYCVGRKDGIAREQPQQPRSPCVRPAARRKVPKGPSKADEEAERDHHQYFDRQPLWPCRALCVPFHEASIGELSCFAKKSAALRERTVARERLARQGGSSTASRQDFAMTTRSAASSVSPHRPDGAPRPRSRSSPRRSILVRLYRHVADLSHPGVGDPAPPRDRRPGAAARRMAAVASCARAMRRTGSAGASGCC